MRCLDSNIIKVLPSIQEGLVFRKDFDWSSDLLDI